MSSYKTISGYETDDVAIFLRLQSEFFGSVDTESLISAIFDPLEDSGLVKIKKWDRKPNKVRPFNFSSTFKFDYLLSQDFQENLFNNKFAEYYDGLSEQEFYEKLQLIVDQHNETTNVTDFENTRYDLLKLLIVIPLVNNLSKLADQYFKENDLYTKYKEVFNVEENQLYTLFSSIVAYSPEAITEEEFVEDPAKFKEADFGFNINLLS